jgi:hypothetical protein
MGFANWLGRATLAAALGFAGHPVAQAGPAGQAAASEAAGAVLQGDAVAALQRLRSVPAAEFEGKDATFRECMLQRFGGAADTTPASTLPDAFAQAVLRAYRAYWRDALLHPAERPRAETALLQELQRLVDRPGLDMEAITPLIEGRLQQAGYHALGGMTPPLQEFMLWTRQEQRQVSVALPEGRHDAPVVLLDGFASLGWGDYATCHRHGAGGWATPQALYAVVPRYDSLDDEEFRVVFLSHETQHFADMARFPELPSWRLEYRAKLTELALADQVRPKLLGKFAQSQGDSIDAPHGYANKRVLLALRRRLGLAADAPLQAVEPQRLRDAAAEELRADTERLAKGAKR